MTMRSKNNSEISNRYFKYFYFSFVFPCFQPEKKHCLFLNKFISSIILLSIYQSGEFSVILQYFKLTYYNNNSFMSLYELQSSN